MPLKGSLPPYRQSRFRHFYQTARALWLKEVGDLTRSPNRGYRQTQRRYLNEKLCRLIIVILYFYDTFGL